MNKDWTGNSRSAHATLGARNYALEERETNDYYATHPSAAQDLMRIRPDINNIWECACGEGHLAKEFDKQGKLHRATDLFDRGYGVPNFDFLTQVGVYDGWIVTNPPYYAQEFCEKAIETSGNVAMFLKIQFLEGKRRKKFFEKYPPGDIYVYSFRQRCAMNGDFEKYAKSNAVSYAWYIWEKDNKDLPTIHWI
jgi:hypothetical protein